MAAAQRAILRHTRVPIQTLTLRNRPFPFPLSLRSFSSHEEHLTREEVIDRVLDVVKCFPKIDDPSKVDEDVQRAVVNEACPKCHHPELEYYTKQLRSADEGQTVFYECPKCGHKFSINT